MSSLDKDTDNIDTLGAVGNKDKSLNDKLEMNKNEVENFACSSKGHCYAKVTGVNKKEHDKAVGDTNTEDDESDRSESSHISTQETDTETCNEHDIDDEHKTLTKNYEYIKSFLINLKQRGVENMSTKTRKVVSNIRKELNNYIKDTETGKKTGAIPKRKGRKRNRNVHRERYNTETNEHTQDNTSDDEINRKNKKGNRRVKINVKDILNKARIKKESISDAHGSNSSITDSDSSDSLRNDACACKKKNRKKEDKQLTKLLNKLDTRTVPEIGKYNENENIDLVQYLNRFEDYCKGKFRGKSYLWTHELEKLLTGKMLEGFKAVKNFEDNYEETKEKLLEWYYEEDEMRRRKAKQKFNNARPRSKENMFIYSKRLETLYQKAHPKHKVKTSNTLMTKFKDSCSTDLKDIIVSQEFSHKLNEQNINWKFIQKCARIYDLNIGEDSEGEIEEEKEIIINLNEDVNARNYRHENDIPKKVYKQEFVNNRYKNNNNYGRKDGRQKYYANHKNKQQFDGPPDLTNAGRCGTCNRFGHTDKYCRKRLNACYICGRCNHFYKDCFYNKQNRQSRYRSKSMSPRRHYNYYNRHYSQNRRNNEDKQVRNYDQTNKGQAKGDPNKLN